MNAAVLAATHKPMMEKALKDLLSGLAQIPDDVDWMAFQQGMARYAANTEKVVRPDYPELARAGRATLHDAGGEGPPLVVVPSMVNRGYVLDLCEGHSLVAAMREAGFHVLLVDWGEPGPESILTLEQVVADGLVPLVRAAAERFGPVQMFGYCMGGLLAVAASAVLGEETVRKLAVAAMPWDFGQTSSAAHMQAARPLLEPWLGAQAVVPPDVMAQYFWLLDPWGPVRRVMAYGRETNPDKLHFLTALEDWLGDGLGLDGPIAREMLLGWYADNTALKGQWRISGVTVNPGELKMPLWVCITQNDVLVPQAASLPFVGQTKGAQVVMADTGHVGLVCGRRAAEVLYRPLAAWLKG